MALIVEDGTNVTGAESYLTVSAADTYFSDRGNAAWAALTTAQKEEHLRIAAARLDNGYRWRGLMTNPDTQAMEWPRWAVDDSRGRRYDSDEIPQRLKDAQAELANQNRVTSLDVIVTGRQVTSESLDVLSVEYTRYGTDTKIFPWIDDLVAPLTSGGGASQFVKG